MKNTIIRSTLPVLLLSVLIVGLIAGACAAPVDQPAENQKPAAATDADNTARNADHGAGALTPLDQGNNESDLQISANIRKSVLADASLSVNAHNIKIITSGGTVTLQGPVKSQHEKDVIETKAKQVAGVGKVNNLVEIETSK